MRQCSDASVPTDTRVVAERGGGSLRASLEATAAAWMRFWQGAGLEGFDSVHSADFVDHSSAGRAADRDGFRGGIEALYRAFPDFHAVIETTVVDEARAMVAIRWSAVGHLRGTFLGAAPSGQRVSFSGIEIIAVRDGQITDRWGAWDEAAIREQMGLR